MIDTTINNIQYKAGGTITGFATISVRLEYVDKSEIFAKEKSR